MQAADRQRTLGPVGRDAELAEVREFLAAGSPAQALVFSGGPGIGKTTLLEAGLELAAAQGLRVLAARPASSEIQLSFAALGDLLDGVGAEELAGLPGPQRRALEVALLRAEPAGAPPEPRAVAVGVLSALRELAGRAPLLVAVDDLQWLDPQSADALTFAARRLSDEPVRFLLARRAPEPSALERALLPARVQRVEVGPLSLGATRRLLSDALDLTLPRRVLRQVVHGAHGNPLFALELGRTLVVRGLPQIGEDLVMPEAVEDVMGARVAGLPAAQRRLVLAVALSPGVRLAQLAALAEAGPLEAALGAGVLIAEGERVRLSHPLLATAARGRAQAGERRALHRALAATIADPERRARHLALATAQPDGELAARLDAAARAAAARGASEDAVELAGHALRLTPPATPARDERLVALAEFLDIAGEERRVVELLAPEIDALAHGMARSRALVLLADNAVGGAAEYEQRLTQALAEAADDPLRRAPVLARLSLLGALTRVERLGEAEAWAREALPAARRAGAEVERDLLHALAWARSMRGHPVDEERARFAAASPAMSSLDRSVERVAAVRLGWRGEVEEARAELTRLLALADERGEAWSYAALRLHRCEVELRAGGWDAAARLLDEWEASADGVLFVAPAYERCRALLAVGRGDREDAERWVVRVLAGVEATGVRWEQLEALRTRGIAALMADDAARAVESLQQVWDVTQREGVDDPGTFPVAPDLAEALAESGAHGAAAAVADRVQELGERQAHPWALVTARRCRALAQLAAPGPDDDAATELEQAAAGYADLGLPFDHARTLLLLGRAQRRRRKWGEARRCLEAAAAGFGALGSPGWAEQASSELARVGARRPRPAGELTATEERVARLAADGRSNKEIAQALFVTVHTVEAHLSHAYAKLGVRSRGQLAGRL